MQGSDSNVFAYDSFIRVSSRKKRRGRDPDKRDAATPCDRLTRVKEEIQTEGGWLLGCEGTYFCH